MSNKQPTKKQRERRLRQRGTFVYNMIRRAYERGDSDRVYDIAMRFRMYGPFW